MPKIIINQKICDKSPDCGGIAVCPEKALFFDEKSKSVKWDQNKCLFDIQKEIKNLTFYKLNAKKYPELAKKLGVTTFPALQLIIDGKNNLIYQGDIEDSKLLTINNSIKEIIN